MSLRLKINLAYIAALLTIGACIALVWDANFLATRVINLQIRATRQDSLINTIQHEAIAEAAARSQELNKLRDDVWRARSDADWVYEQFVEWRSVVSEREPCPPPCPPPAGMDTTLYIFDNPPKEGVK